MLATLQSTLKRLGAARAEQAALVQNLDEPRRKLAEIEAQIAQAEQQRQEAEAQVAHKTAVLADVRRLLGRIEPRRDACYEAAQLLESIEGDLDFAVFNATANEASNVRVALRDYVLLIDAKIAERDQLIVDLKALGVLKP